MTLSDLRRTVAAASAAATLVLAAACSAPSAATSADSDSTTETTSATTSLTAVTMTLDDTHADDNDGEYDEADATTITLTDGASTVSGAGAQVDGDVVSISAAGTYVLSGSLSDGQVVVDSPGDGKVLLVLDGVDITSATSSPVVVTEADEVVVILADGSTNALADSAASGADDEEEDAPTAALFSMGDLTIAGTGSLVVTGASNDAIGSKDGLVVLSGDITVDAVDDGIRGKDYLYIAGGTLAVTAGGDGLKSDNDTDGELGWVQLEAGSVTVSAGSQGVDAVGAIAVLDGELSVDESEEGLQAAAITIAGGAVAVTATDDGLNATAHTASGGSEQVENGVDATVTGGTVTIAAGSDGIDSNGTASLSGGTVAIAASAGGGGNGALDVNGTLTAAGLVTVDAGVADLGQWVAVADADGDVVANFQVNQVTAAYAVAAAGLTSGESYTVYTGDGQPADGIDGMSEAGTVQATDASQSAAMGGPRGGAPGGGAPGGGGRGPGPGTAPDGADETTPAV